MEGEVLEDEEVTGEGEVDSHLEEQGNDEEGMVSNEDMENSVIVDAPRH